MTDDWRPHPGPQEQFCASGADEVLYGGQAGGGKSAALLLEALRYVHVPGYHAVIFRRTHPELERSLVPKSQEMYPALGGRYASQQKAWVFPAGAVIRFCHLEHDKSIYDHASAEYAYIGFDELTEFTETQYRYLQSRNRTTAKDPKTGKTVRCVIRSGSNPQQPGQPGEWVMERWAAWVDDQHAKPAESGEMRWFVVDEDGEEHECAKGTKGALSRVFIRARLEDNPTLTESDPRYADRLSALPLLIRQALKYGVWGIKASGGVLKREWLKHRVEFAPEGLRWVRYYDLAASTKERASRTATVAAALGEGVLYLRRGYAARIEWPEQVKLIRSFMLREPETTHGIENKMHGLPMVQELRRDPKLAHITFYGVEPKGDKLQRALRWSKRAEEGKVVFVTEGDPSWIPGWVDECVGFDGSGTTFDDRVDAASGCVQMIGVGAPTLGAAKHARRKSTSVRRGRFAASKRREVARA